ncbi:MAG: thioredoxin family protein [Akkermansiaceae bacterium]
MRPYIIAALTCFLSLSAKAAQDKLWHADFEAAKQKAAQENKDLLLHFSGSDWCGWCMKLSHEVLSKKAFADEISEDFVMVNIDFPRRKELAPELSQQNAILKAAYTVTSYPTIILCDSQGRPYARTGYRKADANAYHEHITRLRENKKTRDAGFAAAKNLKGIQKARTLEKALSLMPSSAFSFYENEALQIHTADPDDVSGFYNRYLIQKTSTEVRSLAKPFLSKGNYKALIEEVDHYIRENKLTAEPLQTALLVKLTTHYISKNHDEALKCADKIIAINDISNPGRYATMLKKRLIRKAAGE